MTFTCMNNYIDEVKYRSVDNKLRIDLRLCYANIGQNRTETSIVRIHLHLIAFL